MTRRFAALLLAVSLATAPTTAWADEVDDSFAQDIKPAKVNLTEDGSQWIRIIGWLQVWTRAMELNPGSTVQGEPEDWAFDVGIRRARLLVYSQIAPRVHLLFHFGINNQTFNSARNPQLYVHDAWAEVDVFPKALSMGAGLLYFNGVSRLTNASTLNFLALDAPIVNWPTIERTDQFARQLGLYAKGQIGIVDYRLALVRPFSTSVTLKEGGPADYRSGANTFGVSSYVQLMFDDMESNALPFMVGTYLGKKSVFNLGVGVHFQPDAMAQLADDGEVDTVGELTKHDLLAVGVDAFVDRPIGGGALTGYLAYYFYDFGPDAHRNVGIMNIAAGGTSFNGAGNAYPVIGTGSHIYTQWGFLLPGEGVRLQPYVTLHAGLIEALDDPMLVAEVGANLFLSGHNAKLTLNYRNRPVFITATDGSVVEASRASELILQLALFR